MKNETVVGIMLTLLLISVLSLTFNIQPVKATPTTIIVPDDYSTIQAAVDTANEGDTIFVRDGAYAENVVINKTLSLIGQDPATTKIVGLGGMWNGNPALILADDAINVMNLTLYADYTPSLEILNCSNTMLEKCAISANSLSLNGMLASVVQDATNITVEDCQFQGGIAYPGPAILMQNTNSSTIEGCNLDGACALTMTQSIGNRISRNHIYSRLNGANLVTPAVKITYSNNNTFLLNSVSCQTSTGGSYTVPLMTLDNSSFNIFYHNNLYLFQWHDPHMGDAYVAPPSVSDPNTWDGGYPSGGNYWSDYRESDVYSGPYQNVTGSDGIGDIPYYLGSGNRDNYPLMVPYVEFDVAVTNVSPSANNVILGSTLRINVSVENHGRSSLYCDLDLVANYTSYMPRLVAARLTASAEYGWNYTNPGPTITVNQGDTVVLTLEGVDIAHHSFYVDLNGNGFNDSDEPQSPIFINTTITFQFVADRLGTCSYYCWYHQFTMHGQFVVLPLPPPEIIKIGSQNVFLASGEKMNVTFAWNTTGFSLGNYTLSAYAWPVPYEVETIDNLYIDGTVQINLPLSWNSSFSAGWNIVSFPCLPEDTNFSSLFSGVGYYQVLTWNGVSYVTPTAAEAGRGYWVLVLADANVTVQGVPVHSYELDLPAGWSMIGSVYNATVNASTVFPGYYQLLTWSGTSYIDAKSVGIQPGKGYWALALEPTHIIVD